MSHEQSITIESDNQYYNIPTVVGGKKVTNDEAARLFSTGKLQPFGIYGSLKDAVSAAQQRSNMAEATPSYQQELEQYKGDTKAVFDQQIAEDKAATEAGIAKLQEARKGQAPEFERFKQRQAEVEALPPPKLERPPQAPNTQEMLKPTSLQRSVGMASIFALLSVGLAKGSAIYGLKALGGFMEGAHLGNVEQAHAALTDFNSQMSEVQNANDSAMKEYNAVFQNKKYTLEMQEHAIHLKALEFKDELMIQQLREKGMMGGHALIRERAKVDFEFAKERQRYSQWEETIRHHKAMEGKGGAGGTGEQSVFGIPMADIPEAPPGQKNEAFLKMLPPAQASIVRRVANGDIDLRTYGGMGKAASENRINYGNAAILYDPSFKTRLSGILEKAEKEGTPGGKIGGNALAINTLAEHIDQYAERFAKLNNSQIQKWNSTKNKLAMEFGDPALQNVQVPAGIAAAELARIVKGGTAAPTEDEIKYWEGVFNTSSSPKQAMGVIWQALKASGGRLTAIQDSYEQMGLKKEVLTPEARRLILKHKPANEPTPDWLKSKKNDLSDLEKQAELTDKDKAGIKENIYPRARNPKTGEVLIFKGGQWQSP